MRRLDIWRHQSESRHPVLYVTFNYDTLVEQALTAHLGARFTEFDAFITDPRFALVKLHGSVDWAHPVANDLPPQLGEDDEVRRWLAEHAPELEVSRDFVRATHNTSFSRTDVAKPATALYPALAIPVERKPHFECPPAHVDKVRELLPHVTHLLCIGWKARELTFLDMLQDKLPRDTGIRAEFVTSSASTADDVRRRVGGPVSDFDVVGSPFDVDSGFSDLMARERLAALLSSPVHDNGQSA